MSHQETRRQMARLVRQWEASGQTQLAFAARHGISRTKLRYWQRRLTRRDEAQATAVTFAPVQIVPTVAEPGTVDLVLATGERVVVRPGASADLVRTVLAAVRTAC